MGSILVLLQQNEGRILKSSLSAVRAARELAKVWGKTELNAATFGTGASAAADAALRYGFAKVLYSEHDSVAKYLAGPCAEALRLAKDGCAADVVVLAGTSTGKDLAPRYAALVDAGQASEITQVNGDGSLVRPMFAGNVFAEVVLAEGERVVTVRPTAFAPAEESAVSGAKQELALNLDASTYGEVLGYEMSGGGRPELGDAEIVVSGGRAMQSADNFQKYIFPLADALNAAVGASRAAVDSGYAPNDWQVGQTGKVVAPKLYLAVGISGAIQHLAGMKDSKTIVAINKDGEAPIFEVADYGLVADLFTAVPELTEAVKRAKGS